MVPWMVPFLYAFMFIRVSDNEWVSAVVIIAASIASHVAWNFSYVANATLISVVGKTPEDKATLASSRATWNNIGGLLFSIWGFHLQHFLPDMSVRKINLQQQLSVWVF